MDGKCDEENSTLTGIFEYPGLTIGGRGKKRGVVLNWLVRVSFWTLALLILFENNVSMCIYFSRIYLRQKVLMGQNVSGHENEIKGGFKFQLNKHSGIFLDTMWRVH